MHFNRFRTGKTFRSTQYRVWTSRSQGETLSVPGHAWRDVLGSGSTQKGDKQHEVIVTTTRGTHNTWGGYAPTQRGCLLSILQILVYLSQEFSFSRRPVLLPPPFLTVLRPLREASARPLQAQHRGGSGHVKYHRNTKERTTILLRVL